MIDVFAGRQRRDRSIGEEVKVEPRSSQGNALGPVEVKVKIEVEVKIKVEPRESQWNVLGPVGIKVKVKVEPRKCQGNALGAVCPRKLSFSYFDDIFPNLQSMMTPTRSEIQC